MPFKIHLDACRRFPIYAGVLATTLAWSLSLVNFLDAKNLALWAANLLLWAWNMRRGVPVHAGFRALAPCWGGLALVSVVGILHAPVPQYVALEALRIAGLLLFVSQAWPLLRGRVAERQLVLGLGGAACAAAVLALLQRAGALPGIFPSYPHYDQAMYSVFGNQGLLGGFVALGLTAVIALLPAAGSRNRVWLGLAAAVLFTALVLAASRAALLSLVIGVAGLVVFRLISGRAVLAGLVAAVALTALVELASGGTLIARWAGTLGDGDIGGRLRPWVWRASLDLARNQPWLGVGLGNYVYGLPIYLGATPLPPGLEEAAALTTDHAHFDLLEVVCESGLLGLFVIFMIAARLRLRAPHTFACLIALAAFSCLHPAWASTPHALAGLLCFAQNTRPPVRKRRARVGSRRVHVAAGIGAIAGCATFVTLVLYPSFLLRRAEDRHLAELPARDAYAAAVRAWGALPEAHESQGIYAFEQGEYGLAWDAFLRAKAGLDTGRIGQLLAMTAAARGDQHAACRWYQFSAARWPHDAAIREAALVWCGRSAVLKP